MGLLSDRELASLLPAETHAFAGPIPTQSVSSDEFMPAPQTARQRRLEGRQISFIIYHGGYRFAGGGKVEDAWAQFEKTGRIEWVTDLAEIPSKHGVSNVYADVGQL